MAFLTREQVLSAQDCGKFDSVSVPEWGGELRLRVITGAERYRFDEYRAAKFQGGNDPGPMAFLVALCACDEAGKPLFRPDDIKSLGEKSDAALRRAFDAACKLNGIGLQAVEDAEKNSQSSQSLNSGTT